MSQSKDEGYSVALATTRQLDSYRIAQQHVDAFASPVLYDKSDDHARVFFALFDGTGNDMVQDPEHMTNVGLVAAQLMRVIEKNAHIGAFYKEGVGTQGGWPGMYDKATGSSFSQRVEMMYVAFSEQAERWIEEDSLAHISVVIIGYSRGAEQSAAFSRILDTRGVLTQEWAKGGVSREQFQEYFDAPRLREPGTIPQALALLDPVGTFEPQKHDRRPAPSVVTGLQISAADERRALFPLSHIMGPGLSEDGRFLGITTAGAHSDIGGGFLMDGLARCNFNLLACYLNGMLKEPVFTMREVPALSQLVVHDAWWTYILLEERVISLKLEPTGKLSVEGLSTHLQPFADTRTVLGSRSEQAVLTLDDTNTVAFNDIGRHAEIGLVLRAAAERLRDGEVVPFALEDTNGNDVGCFELLGVGSNAAHGELAEGGVRITFQLRDTGFTDETRPQVASLIDGAAERIANAGSDFGFMITNERGALLGMVAISPAPLPQSPALQPGDTPVPRQ